MPPGGNEEGDCCWGEEDAGPDMGVDGLGFLSVSRYT